MMSELFDEEYLQEQYNKSRDREMLAEGRAKGRVEGTVLILIGLVRDGILTVADAAKRANMSVSEFETRAELV